MKIVVRAPLLSISGYGQHSRQVFEAVKMIPGSEVFTQIVQWGNTSWFIDQDLENGLVGDIMSRSTDQQSDFDVSFQVQLPDEWSQSLAKINIGITAAVETDVCNPAWVEACNKMSAIIVPSQFTKGVLQNTGAVKTPIYVVPEWFIEEIETVDAHLDIPLRTRFNFLIVSQMTAADSSVDRKNIANTIKWICDTFKDDNDVGIVLKTNSGRGTAIDKSMTAHALKSLVESFGKDRKVPIYFLHGNMTNKEIASLYTNPKIKALVSLTRGEGFGLPILEAAASGLPVIATDWSAHTEFLNVGKWIKIDQSLVEVPEQRIDNRIFMRGSKWANPSEEAFKKKVKKFRESSDMPRQWATEMKGACRDRFGKSAILKTYDHVISEILKNG
jgi:glycosyltransferase involved in cell wall biosynthesis